MALVLEVVGGAGLPARRTALRTRQSRSGGGSGEEQRMGWRMGLAGLRMGLEGRGGGGG